MKKNQIHTCIFSLSISDISSTNLAGFLSSIIPVTRLKLLSSNGSIERLIFPHLFFKGTTFSRIFEYSTVFPIIILASFFIGVHLEAESYMISREILDQI